MIASQDDDAYTCFLQPREIARARALLAYGRSIQAVADDCGLCVQTLQGALGFPQWPKTGDGDE